MIPGYGGGSGHLAPGHVEAGLKPAVIGRQRIVGVCQLLNLRNNYLALQTKGPRSEIQIGKDPPEISSPGPGSG